MTDPSDTVACLAGAVKRYGSLDALDGFDLREAVTNIARHADATQARIEMERAPASVRLQISDNGRGGIDGEGNGLCGMRERVRVLGGTLVIASPRGGGTRVEIEVPMPVMRLVQPVRSSPDMPSAGSLATTASGHSAA